jgi:hypothetical protein
MRAHGREIRAYANRHVLRLMACEVVELDGAELLDDDGARPGVCSLEIETVAVQSFVHLPALRVIHEQAHGPIAVGQEIHAVTHPHRVMIVRVLPRHLGDARILQIGEPDRRGLAPAIAFPRGLPLAERQISDVRAIRRIRGVFDDGQRHLRGEATADRNRVELILTVTEAVAVHREHHVLAVRRPATH